MKTKALWIFLGTIAVTVGSLLLFIQSKFFADILKQTARKYMPRDFGVEGDFSELAVKMIPPGVVIKNPAVVFKEKNPAGFPAGTKLDAQFIDVTFQFFQLMTGEVTINAFAIHGATLKLELDQKFFAAHEQSLQPRKSGGILSWDSLFRFNFRSVSLIDSQIDVRIVQRPGASPVHVQSFAKELTVGRSTVDQMPAYDLAVDLQKAYVEAPYFKHALAQFQASVEISAKGAAVRNLGMQDGELNVHANGKVAGNILNPKALKSELSYIVRGPIPAWLDPSLVGQFVKLPKDANVAGNIEIEGKLLGDLLDLEHTLETKATVQLDGARYSDWKVDKATIKGTWKMPLVQIDSAEVALGDGKIRLGKTSYDLSRSSQKIDVAADFEEADIRRMLGPVIRAIYPLHLRVNGKVRADVTLGQKFGIDGDADLIVHDFSLDNQKPDVKKPLKVILGAREIALKTRFDVDGGGVRFDQTVVTLPHSKLNASGSVTAANGFDIDVKGDINMSDIGKLAAFDIAGVGGLHWTITGKKPYIVFTFDCDMKDAAYLNLKLGQTKGRVVYNDGTDTLSLVDLHATQGRLALIANGNVDVGDKETVGIKVQVPGGTIEDFAVLFTDFLKKSVPWYPYELSGKVSGQLDVSGKTDMAQLSVEGDMEFQNVDFRHEIFRYAKMHAGYRRGAYIAEDVSIQKKAGWVRGGMSVSPDNTLRFDLRSEGLSTLDIDHLAAFGVPYRAPLSIETRGTGKLGTLKSTFRLSAGEGFVKSHPVQGSEVSFVTDEGRIRGLLSVFGGRARGRLDLGWAAGSTSQLDLEARDFDFRPILMSLNPDLTEDASLTAEISGQAHLKFLTGSLSRLTGNVAFESYHLSRTGYLLELQAPVRFDLREGNYEFEGAKLIGTGTALSANGRVKDGKIDYAIKGDLSLDIFEFLVKEIASVKGSSHVDAAITGRADSPHLNASIVTTGADLRLRHIEQPFEDLRFKAAWNDFEMNISDISAKFAGGMVRGDGTVVIYPYKVPDLDFRMELDNPKVKVYPVAYARTSGKLSLSGDDLPYKVKGSLSVAEALIQENFAPNEGSRVLRSSKFLPQTKGTVMGDIQVFDLDVDLAAERNIFIRNDLFDAELKGSLKIINSIQTPRLLGNVTVLHGRLLFKDNFFTIQNANLHFTNPAALDPEFDLNGQTEMKGYKVLLVAAGKASDYKLNFQSQPPLSQNDIVNLLTLGVTSSDFKNISRENRDAYSRDELYGLLFNQSGINKGLQEKLGVKVRVDQTQNNTPENAFRARQTSDAVESVAPKVVLQKQITKNLNASVGSTVGVGGSQEHNADVELGIDRNWSIMGTYEDQRGSQLRQSRTSIGADFKYRLRFK